MSITHILKDGTEIKDIQGHIVRASDAEPLYRMIHSINSQGRAGSGSIQDQQKQRLHGNVKPAF